MRKYESIVIFSANVGDAQIKQEVSKLENFLKAQGAENLAVDHWGKKNVLFEHRRHLIGDYKCLKFESANHDIVDGLIGQLRITDGIIKFETHRISDRVRKFKGSIRKKAPSDSGLDDVIGDEIVDEVE